MIVTSKDGAKFTVQTQARSSAAELKYAASKSADELKRHGDFVPWFSIEQYKAVRT
jgi:hypothetical protein